MVDLYWNLRGPRLGFPSIPPTVRSVLFVCKGNICRSPFAEHVAQKLESDGHARGVIFASAGLHVSKPKAPPSEAIRVAEKFGVDIEKHRSQVISRELMESFDLIVSMEVWQHAELNARFPQYRRKLFVLPLLEPDPIVKVGGYAAFNIEDPYGGSPAAFEQCFLRIERCVSGFLGSLARPH
jgi:protein-tyrosine phosphatase